MHEYTMTVRIRVAANQDQACWADWMSANAHSDALRAIASLRALSIVETSLVRHDQRNAPDTSDVRADETPAPIQFDESAFVERFVARYAEKAAEVDLTIGRALWDALR